MILYTNAQPTPWTAATWALWHRYVNPHPAAGCSFANYWTCGGRSGFTYDHHGGLQLVYITPTPAQEAQPHVRSR